MTVLRDIFSSFVNKRVNFEKHIAFSFSESCSYAVLNFWQMKPRCLDKVARANRQGDCKKISKILLSRKNYWKIFFIQPPSLKINPTVPNWSERCLYTEAIQHSCIQQQTR